MRASRNNERGVALAVALFALAVIGGLVAANFIPGWLEQQSGQNLVFTAQAAEGAEAGLAVALAELAPAALESLPVGGAAQNLEAIVPAPGLTSGRQVSRLTPELFLIRAVGVRRDAGGRPLAIRSVAMLAAIERDSGGVPAVRPLGQRAWVQLY